MSRSCDVIVMGGGLAGLAVSLLLSRRGHHVVCIGPTPQPDLSLGESLDFAAPVLFAELGFECDAMVQENSATYKKLIKVVTDTGEDFVLRPPEFLKSRFGLETKTIHVNRAQFDASLRKTARQSGVELVDTKVTRLHSGGDAICSCVTREGEYRARWYVDATSQSRVASRHFRIPCRRYGESKVAIWSHIESVPDLEGTTLHMMNASSYLEWIWEIPVSKDRASIGLVQSSQRLRVYRHPGEPLDRLLARRLGAMERFGNIEPTAFKSRVRACAFSNSVVARPFGANWIAIGEAAAMVDPLTSSGASAAIRHARMAAVVVDNALANAGSEQHILENYNRCVQALGDAFNRNIERTVYQPMLRKNLNLYWAAFAYTIFGYFFNALYQRLDFCSDQELRRMGIAQRGFGVWLSIWQFIGRFTRLFGSWTGRRT